MLLFYQIEHRFSLSLSPLAALQLSFEFCFGLNLADFSIRDYFVKQQNIPASDESSTSDVMVRNGADELLPFDLQQLTESLTRKLGIEPELASRIGLDVKQLVQQFGVRQICPSLIRGLIDTKLLEYGLDEEYRKHQYLGLLISEVDNLVQQQDHYPDYRPLDPSETSTALGNMLKSEYAQLAVFSGAVASAHRSGEIHIEKSDKIDCIYSLCLSPDYLKRVGSLLPMDTGVVRSVRDPEEFISRLFQSSLALGRCLSGPLYWDSLNFTLAPLVNGWSEQATKALAESLLQQFSALSGRCEFYLDWDAPSYLADRPALGADGGQLGMTYRELSGPARKLLIALLEVYLSGNQSGLPVLNPRPIFYLPGEATSVGTGLDLLGRLVRERGQCEVRFAHKDLDTFVERYGLRLGTAMQKGAWEWRTGVFQAVAVNLPRAALRAEGDRTRLLEILTEMLEKAAQAHLEKRIYLEKLLARGEQGPLALLSRHHSGSGLLKLNRTIYWICPVGLDEMARIALGRHLHQDEETLKFGEYVCRHLAGEVERLSALHKVHFLLAHFDGGASPGRFARLDRRYFPEAISKIMPEQEASEPSYTPGASLPSSAVLTLDRRINIEAALHADSFHAAVTSWKVPANPLPYTEEAREWLLAGMNEPLSQGLRFHLDFAVCLDCRSALRGRPDSCPLCQSARVQQYI
jgi:ribonucleoside-triphosphate reductase (formate)